MAGRLGRRTVVEIQIVEEGLGNRGKTMGDIVCLLSCLELFNDQRYDAIRLIFGHKSSLDLAVRPSTQACIQNNTRQWREPGLEDLDKCSSELGSVSLNINISPSLSVRADLAEAGGCCTKKCISFIGRRQPGIKKRCEWRIFFVTPDGERAFCILRVRY